MRFIIYSVSTGSCAYFSFQITLEVLQELRHVRVSLKVAEVIINPKQNDPCHLRDGTCAGVRQ